MNDAMSGPDFGASVLELLRRFKQDDRLADGYAHACLEKAKAAEPVLKAFEYLPVDVSRRPGPLSGVPVAIKDIIATSDMRPPTDRRSTGITFQSRMPGSSNACAVSARRFSAKPYRRNSPGVIPGRRPIPGIPRIRRAAHRRAPPRRGRPGL